MKKQILKRIKEKIDLIEIDWADAYIAKQFQSSIDSPLGRKEVDAADHKMKECDEKLVFLKRLLKSEQPK